MTLKKGLVTSGNKSVAVASVPQFEKSTAGMEMALEQLGVEECISLLNSQLFTRTKNRLRDYVNQTEPTKEELQEARVVVLSLPEMAAAREAANADPITMIRFMDELDVKALGYWDSEHSQRAELMAAEAKQFESRGGRE